MCLGISWCEIQVETNVFDILIMKYAIKIFKIIIYTLIWIFYKNAKLLYILDTRYCYIKVFVSSFTSKFLLKLKKMVKMVNQENRNWFNTVCMKVSIGVITAKVLHQHQTFTRFKRLVWKCNKADDMAKTLL